VFLFFLLYLSFVYAAIEINFSMNKVDYYFLYLKDVFVTDLLYSKEIKLYKSTKLHNK